MSSYTSTVDFPTRVGVGTYSNISSVNKFGRNLDLDAGVAEEIWTAGGLYIFQSGAAQLDVSSSDAADDNTPPGTGARSVHIFGTDGSDNYIDEEIDLNGVSVVTTVASFKRVFRAFVASVGSTGSNVGVITIQVTGAGDTQAQIRATVGQTEMAIYSVATDKVALLQKVDFGVLGSNNAELTFEMFINDANGVTRLVDTWLLKTSLDTSLVVYYKFGPRFTGPADIYIRATSSANNMDAKASFDLLVADA